MERIYFDNAATTSVLPEVLDAMMPYLANHFGNPSSQHSFGREVRTAIERSRKTVAEIVGCQPGEIFFTSGGTEANNAIIAGAIHTFAIQHAISSPIEHHAVETTLHAWASQGITLHNVLHDEDTHLDYVHLEKLLKQHPNALVSLMQVNNEVGNLTDVVRVGELCEKYNAYFHSDMVQAIGHFPIKFSELLVHGASCAAHKFHGPKGIGFMYLNKKKKIDSFIKGGLQERGMRGGTENPAGIVGLAKALEISVRDLAKNQAHIEKLKTRLIEKLKQLFPSVQFNGDSANLERSTYTVVNFSLPELVDNEIILFQLDMQHIALSGGSACTSGANTGSHVMNHLYPNEKRRSLRTSFSHLNTEQEVDTFVACLTSLVHNPVAV